MGTREGGAPYGAPAWARVRWSGPRIFDPIVSDRSKGQCEAIQSTTPLYFGALVTGSLVFSFSPQHEPVCVYWT